jgi:hypothetical protein
MIFKDHAADIIVIKLRGERTLIYESAGTRLVAQVTEPNEIRRNINEITFSPGLPVTRDTGLFPFTVPFHSCR